MQVAVLNKEKTPSWWLIGKYQFTLHEKCPNTNFFSGPYFPVFGLNTEKYRPEKTPYLDTFHAMSKSKINKSSGTFSQ